MNYYLSFDAGGSKLAAITFDSAGKIYATAMTGGVNSNSSGSADTVKRRIDRCVDRLFEQTGPLPAITAIYGNFFGSAADIRAAVERHCPCGDPVGCGEGSLGALSCGVTDGVVALSGTGSNFFLVRGGRALGSCGGWGYILGDEGGGFSIGRAAVRQAIFESDFGQKPSLLTERLKAAANVANVRNLIAYTYQSGAVVPRLAALVPVVEKAAADGCLSAAAILEAAGRELAETAVRFIEYHHPEEDFPVCLAGSVLTRCLPVQKSFLALLREKRPDSKVLLPLMPPVYGGVLFRRIDAGLPLTEAGVDALCAQNELWEHTRMTVDE